jgi:RNA polymerase sigma-70 factor, ECF subfamily
MNDDFPSIHPKKALRPGTGSGPAAIGPEDLQDLNSLRRRLLARAQKILQDPDDAEDACQEALLRTWTAVWKGRCTPADLAPYAFGTLRNVVHEIRRGRERDVSWNHVEPRDPTPDPASDLVRKEFRATVRSALDELPPPQQQVAVLTLAGGVSCSEVARTQGIAPATVRQRKRRARRLLMARLTGLRAAAL